MYKEKKKKKSKNILFAILLFIGEKISCPKVALF